MGKRLPPVEWVWGLDPGRACGLAVGDASGLCESWQLDCWDELPDLSKYRTGRSALLWEAPQNGTHASRGGVHRAAGMVISRLVDTVDLVRRDVTATTPAEWRKVMPVVLLTNAHPKREDWKRAAVAYALQMGCPLAGEDQAEACGIYEYGRRKLL